MKHQNRIIDQMTIDLYNYFFSNPNYRSIIQSQSQPLTLDNIYHTLLIITRRFGFKNTIDIVVRIKNGHTITSDQFICFAKDAKGITDMSCFIENNKPVTYIDAKI